MAATDEQEFREMADEVIEMWDNDEYDNHKDAIEDARDLLAEMPKSLAGAYKTRLEAVLAAATQELAEMAAEDPDIADYATGLVAPDDIEAAKKAKKAKKEPPAPAKKSTKPKAKKPKSKPKAKKPQPKKKPKKRK
jgi:hypothetical protein